MLLRTNYRVGERSLRALEGGLYIYFHSWEQSWGLMDHCYLSSFIRCKYDTHIGSSGDGDNQINVTRGERPAMEMLGFSRNQCSRQNEQQTLRHESKERKGEGGGR